MYADDVSLLCCPLTFEPLELVDGVEDADGEIVSGSLRSNPSGKHYPIRDGIPRFVVPGTYNESWDYKWTSIDQGRGLNYRIIDKNDRAYRIHDIFDRNGHDGAAFRHASGRLAIDVGCGVGQYSIKLLREYDPMKVVSLDLTGGVDIFRKILLERFPEYRRRVLIVQANVFQMPFRDETFDYAFSLGVLMHTGDTRAAIRQVARILKVEGELNVWIYSAIPVHLDNEEPGRKIPMKLARFVPYGLFYLWTMSQVKMFRRLPHTVAAPIIRFFSSDFWYGLCRLPVIGYGFRIVFGTVMHPDRDYRYINNFDGWCNRWAETWTESELFPTLREANIAIRGISDWQVGIWGKKLPTFYR